LKIEYISVDSVLATKWVDDWWYGTYEAQRLQAKRIIDTTVTAQ